MIRNVDADIERFLYHFREETEQASKLQIEGDEKPTYHQQKIIYSAIIDCLSKCIFPKKGNRERMVSFIIEFSDWENYNRVSLPHLFQLLAKSPEPSFSKLRKFVFEELRLWSSGEIIGLERDPSISEVIKYWPTEKEFKKPLNGINLEFLQHCYLFYSLRNSLVHEFREPGYSFETKYDNAPSYISRSGLGDSEEIETWELLYPAKFLKILIENSLKNLEIYLKQNKLNPYLSYTFGSYWIEELNR
jgi:hypothetical protein